MFHQFSLKDEDLKAASEISRFPHSSKESLPRQQFVNVVVNKPWGYEFLSCESSSTACWNLYIKFNSQTSMHAHPGKQTIMVPLTDGIVLSTLESQHALRSGDIAYIDAGVFHRSTSTSIDGDFMLEFETPVDKFDLIRLDDSYGRVKSAYEGIEHETPTDQGIHFQQWLQSRNFESSKYQFQMGDHTIHFYPGAELNPVSLEEWSKSLNLVVVIDRKHESPNAITFSSPRDIVKEDFSDKVALGIQLNRSK